MDFKIFTCQLSGGHLFSIASPSKERNCQQHPQASECKLTIMKRDNKRHWALESALKSMQNKNPRIVPTLFIEVCGRSYGLDGVMGLLNLLRKWIHEEALVSAVVLSPANEIGEALLHDMRAYIVKVDHLTVNETKDYLLSIYAKRKELTRSREEREQLMS